MSRRAVVALSGGVDSAVSALLLKNDGWDVRAVFMRNWDGSDPHCTVREDFFDALAICERLNIELEAVDLARRYREQVFEVFLEHQMQGLTPNPDVLCNTEIKFAALIEQALGADSDAVLATGHYARRRGRELLCAVDGNKDQTYFMHQVRGDALERVVFPIGHLRKPQVRALAAEAGIPVADKRDSTGLCFIGERHFRSFLRQHIAPQPGLILDESGVCLGEHLGLPYYTLGQRQGLGIGGLSGGSGAPWYVAEKRLKDNILLVVQGADHPMLHARELRTRCADWISGAPPAAEFDCLSRIRHRQPLQACRVQVLDGGLCRVEFARPQWAPTPGQSIVFYSGEVCLGGAVIASRTTLSRL
ncbi:MAG: tRNA 2-thiouridine(34) synthase MnmA [Gammaproteobacteria bacterium AqS3]|nr:tRNA 2-thiouridine(34) synthase MnmA [Gammaproteobacteria bacterium AqS3]